MLEEPLDRGRAKQLVLQILMNGVVEYTKHALTEMDNDNLSELDVTNTLRGGWVEFEELVQGTWRYRVRTNRMAAVVAFRSEEHLAIVTAWRIS